MIFIIDKKLYKTMRLNIDKLISESVRVSLGKVLNEGYNYAGAEIFENNPDLKHLSILVYKFTLESIDNNYDDEMNSHPLFDGFVKGLVKLFDYATEKQAFDKLNVKQKYQEAVQNGNVDAFEDLDELYPYDYIDEYINNMDEWDKYMPTPEQVLNGINMFLNWLETFIESDIQYYTKERWGEYEYFKKELNKLY